MTTKLKCEECGCSRWIVLESNNFDAEARIECDECGKEVVIPLA